MNQPLARTRFAHHRLAPGPLTAVFRAAVSGYPGR
jgi:hypothetical protein